MTCGLGGESLTGSPENSPVLLKSSTCKEWHHVHAEWPAGRCCTNEEWPGQLAAVVPTKTGRLAAVVPTGAGRIFSRIFANGERKEFFLGATMVKFHFTSTKTKRKTSFY